MSKEKKNASAKAPSELDLLARIKTKLPVDDSVIVGAGDDCAVIDAGIPGKWQLHKTDAVVEGVHFTREASKLQHIVIQAARYHSLKVLP